MGGWFNASAFLVRKAPREERSADEYAYEKAEPRGERHQATTAPREVWELRCEDADDDEAAT